MLNEDERFLVCRGIQLGMDSPAAELPSASVIAVAGDKVQGSYTLDSVYVLRSTVKWT